MIKLFIKVPLWKKSMLEADFNQDGKLSLLEFQDAVKLAEKKTMGIQEGDDILEDNLKHEDNE